MKKSEYKQAKHLRRQLKSEKTHLRNLEFEYEMGGRRQSHTPVKSNDPSEQQMLDEVAKSAKKNDAAIIKHQRERIATLKQRFAAIGKPQIEDAPVVNTITIIQLYAIGGDSENREIFIKLSENDYRPLNTGEGGFACKLRIGDYLILQSGKKLIKGRAVDAKGDNGNSKVFKIAPVDSSAADLYAALNYHSINRFKVAID